MPVPAPENRRERKKRERRTRIYNCAAGLVIKQGFDATTVDQISNAADVAQATFFNHFPSKDALLTEMTGEVFNVIQAILEGERKRPAPTRDKLQHMAKEAARVVEATRQLTRDVLLSLTRNTGRPDTAAPLLHQVHEAFAEFIRDGQARGDIRDDQDARFLSEMMVGVFHATVVNWLNEPDYPLGERLERAAVFIGDAVAPSAR